MKFTNNLIGGLCLRSVPSKLDFKNKITLKDMICSVEPEFQIKLNQFEFWGINSQSPIKTIKMKTNASLSIQDFKNKKANLKLLSQ